MVSPIANVPEVMVDELSFEKTFAIGPPTPSIFISALYSREEGSAVPYNVGVGVPEVVKAVLAVFPATSRRLPPFSSRL